MVSWRIPGWPRRAPRCGCRLPLCAPCEANPLAPDHQQLAATRQTGRARSRRRGVPGRGTGKPPPPAPAGHHSLRLGRRRAPVPGDGVDRGGRPPSRSDGVPRDEHDRPTPGAQGRPVARGMRNDAHVPRYRSRTASVVTPQRRHAHRSPRSPEADHFRLMAGPGPAGNAPASAARAIPSCRHQESG